EKNGYNRVLPDDTLTADALISAVSGVYEGRDGYRTAMAQASENDAVANICAVIESIYVQHRQ
ncbi:MAG: hypothetical protein II497_01450, partial [Lachnospiraceae bacterium]|nr:hypothetical protein [Lachnospiraceae bacterium]